MILSNTICHFVLLSSGFVGIKKAFAASDDWRSNVQYTLNTNNRIIYQTPEQEKILKGNNTRWGCNETKQVPAGLAGNSDLVI